LVAAEGIKLRTPLGLTHEELNCAKKNYGKDAKLHEGKGPELHRAEGNRCENEKKDK
jgi:hypothetical protein